MTIYLFGRFTNEYTQYPDDGTSRILKELYSMVKADTQIVIRRDGNLMYYCYIRRFAEQKYCGICILNADSYFTQIDALFPIFEKCIEQLVDRGSIIHFNQSGNLTSSLTKLHTQSEDVILAISNLKIDLETVIQKKKQLPPTDYSISKDSTNYYSASNSIQDIVKSSYTFGNTIVLKEEDYDTIKYNSYRSVLNRINTENTFLKKQNIDLQEKNQQILRKKKQFRNVILLILVLIACSVGIYFLYDNLNNTQGQLNEANGTISYKNYQITSLRSSIDSLRTKFNGERSRRQATEEKLSKVCGYYPFNVISCSVNSESFSFNYFALEEKEITVILRAVNEKSSQVVSENYELTFNKGEGSKTLYFNYKLNSSDYYYVVLIYDEKIIAGKRW